MNVMKMMQQAQGLQAKAKKIQEELGAKEYSTSVSDDAVKLTINGTGELLSLKLSLSILQGGDPEMVEDLVITAFREVFEESKKEMATKMEAVTAGLGLPPGLGL